MERLTEILSRLARVRRVEEVSPLGFVAVLLLSLAAAFFLAWLYRRVVGPRRSGSGLDRSFPLLAVSITAIFLAVQFSLPLSLGLLGALSIVRFRTPVKEPEEIGFLMVVIACALACATFNVLLLGLVLATATCALLLAGVFARGNGMREGVLTVRVDSSERVKAVLEALRSALPHVRPRSVAAREDGVTLALSFRGAGDRVLEEVTERVLAVAPGSSVEAFFEEDEAP